MKEYTDEQVLENRRTWIEFLKDPKRKKLQGLLDNGHGARCCLGHACKVLRIKRTVWPDVPGVVMYGENQDDTLAPKELVAALGLWNRSGGCSSPAGVELPVLLAVDGVDNYNLAGMNDETSMTPRQIGEYLETVIYGGENTPFRPIAKKED